MEKRNVVIKFFAPVMDASINALMNAVDQKIREGISKFTILISSPGGSVFHGLSAYNYLRGIPAEITTHNFGSVDSIGVVIFCAGTRRLSVPQARFLLHGVSVGFRQNEGLEEKQLEERLKGLRIDMENIAKVIALNTNKNPEDIISAMLERTALNPEQALSWGLVHDIIGDLYPSGSEVISIHFQQQTNQP
ncbi:MAG TPA: ATP-dependent Clp protease proteolytic subunit [Candidatus Ratteibacteria bacterium]|nr:ATP-dependent Clp protease proteolytic subunit [bacterium]HOQ82473.1 ATP-dependent Clp protease proteolytic subunit [bacterium]HPC29789.1 ATP-dependent Clp protease proteolytic subunit [bacterium]HRS07073.1 ATP-dependent Clp protease proteolytic subunit [Candidatus Ratteibacteria bacterium]HRV03975.1 ATP-dependent Clp protease proteolytic subunit [Candidatus Ratteibacteria bacterium]